VGLILTRVAIVVVFNILRQYFLFLRFLWACRGVKPRFIFSGCADVCVFPSTPNKVTWHYNVGGPCRVLVNATKAKVGFVSWTNRVREFFWRYLAQKHTKNSKCQLSRSFDLRSYAKLTFSSILQEPHILRSIQAENVVVRGQVTSKTTVQWWFAKYNVHLPCLCLSPA